MSDEGQLQEVEDRAVADPFPVDGSPEDLEQILAKIGPNLDEALWCHDRGVRPKSPPVVD